MAYKRNIEIFEEAYTKLDSNSTISYEARDGQRRYVKGAKTPSGSDDKPYEPSKFSGLGRKNLEKNIVSNKNVLTQAMVADANTVYHIQYDYDLGGATVTMPANSALKMDGGKIDNGKIVFQNTSIESDKECFGEDLEIEGKVLQEANPDWFVGNDADKIEKAIDVFGVVKLAARDYLIDRTINVQHSFRLNGCGIPSNFGNYSTPSKSNDYSSSRLIPVADIGNILACVEPSGKYVSFVLSGVSFVRPTSEAWYNDYQSLTTNVNGFAFSTPNGPSRPAVIENCNFSRLNYGIYIFDGNPSLNRSTNISRLLITGCNISVNREGIHIEGHISAGGICINSNVIEQNSVYGIYADNPTGSHFESKGVINGYCEISNNLMEGQENPLYCSLTRSTIIFKGNYFEYSNHTSTVTVKGKGGLYRTYQTLILDSNHASSRSVLYDLSNLIVIDRDNGNAGGTLLLNNVLIDGETNKKVRTSVFANYMPSENASQPLLIKKINDVNYIYDKKVQLRSFDTNTTIHLVLDTPLQAGNYTLVMFGCNVTAALSSYYDGAVTPIFEQNLITGNSFSVGEKAFTLNGAMSVGYRFLLTVYAGAICSGFAIYADDGSPHYRYSFDLTDYAADMAGEVVNPQIGVERYDSTAGKVVRIADIVDGKAVWKDLNGFTPALSRGTTAERPANLICNADDGFEYYDMTINKDITAITKMIPQNTEITTIGNETKYVTNPFVDGKYTLSFTTHGNSYLNIWMSKGNPEESDADLKRIVTNQASQATMTITIEDASEYPYLKLVNGDSKTLTIAIIGKEGIVWQEEDGATAGVKRNGATADRPASADIYVGFQYWDTDLGKMIAWSGSNWLNLDGTALV